MALTRRGGFGAASIEGADREAAQLLDRSVALAEVGEPFSELAPLADGCAEEGRRVLAIDPRNAEALACVKSFGVGAAASSSKGGAPATVRKSATPKPSDRTKTRPAPSPKAPRGG